MSASDPIQPVTPRETVEAHFPDGRVLSGPRRASAGDFLRAWAAPEMPMIVGAIVNTELHELTFPIEMDSHLAPVTIADPDGMRFYRRSLVFLLETAFSEQFPQATLTVDHSVASGGYFCQVGGRPPLDAAELARLEDRMHALVAADLPFARKEIPLAEAIEYFRKAGAADKVRLLSHRKKDYLTIYQLSGSWDYHHGYMVPSTGYLKWFALHPTSEGFTLRFPRRHAPTTLLPLPAYPKLLATFRQYGDWLNRLGISSVGALDDAIQANRAGAVILVSEALHEQRVSEIAAEIARLILSGERSLRVILISGPSSSGKTTFSRRLSIQLLTRGISPFPLEMDNYFIDRDKTPAGDDGKPDFEALGALDTPRLGSDLRRLILGERVQLPRYDFVTGMSQPGADIQLENGEIVILEGIHGLNPALLPGFPESQAYRIYVSALTQLNLDHHNRVSTTDTRLVRRIIRDARERGYTAQATIQRWESVRRGEKRHIFPYQENADVMFNSALAYELAVLRPFAEPLLRQVPYGTPEFIEAKRLLAFLEWFEPLAPDQIPDNSILREFIGDSILKHFTLWQNQK